MCSFRCIAALAAVFQFARSTPLPSGGTGISLMPRSGTSSGLPSSYASATASPYLNDLAQSQGKLWFGTAADIPGTGEDTNQEYQTILNDTDIFGQLTPANSMKVSSPFPNFTLTPC